jgi:FAD-dependent sensor of blue light
MIQLAYLSSTPVLLTPDDIAQILIISRCNNAKLDITGLLVYKDGSVLQFLEGPEANVQKVFERISGDPRHRGIIVLYRKELRDRDFAEWTMGFSDLKAEGATYLEGFEDVLGVDYDLKRLSATSAQKLIRLFKI